MPLKLHLFDQSTNKFRDDVQLQEGLNHTYALFTSLWVSRYEPAIVIMEAYGIWDIRKWANRSYKVGPDVKIGHHFKQIEYS